MRSGPWWCAQPISLGPPVPSPSHVNEPPTAPPMTEQEVHAPALPAAGLAPPPPATAFDYATHAQAAAAGLATPHKPTAARSPERSRSPKRIKRPGGMRSSTDQAAAQVTYK